MNSNFPGREKMRFQRARTPSGDYRKGRKNQSFYENELHVYPVEKVGELIGSPTTNDIQRIME
jgi:hypothetical protein